MLHFEYFQQRQICKTNLNLYFEIDLFREREREIESLIYYK